MLGLFCCCWPRNIFSNPEGAYPLSPTLSQWGSSMLSAQSCPSTMNSPGPGHSFLSLLFSMHVFPTRKCVAQIAQILDASCFFWKVVWLFQRNTFLPDDNSETYQGKGIVFSCHPGQGRQLQTHICWLIENMVRVLGNFYFVFFLQYLWI